MSRRFETTVTLVVDGDETDCTVRGNVLVEPGLGMGGGFGATLDGPAEALVDDEWVDVAEFGEGAAARVSDALCDVALDDDSSQCVEHDDFDRDCA